MIRKEQIRNMWLQLNESGENIDFNKKIEEIQDKIKYTDTWDDYETVYVKNDEIEYNDDKSQQEESYEEENNDDEDEEETNSEQNVTNDNIDWINEENKETDDENDDSKTDKELNQEEKIINYIKNDFTKIQLESFKRIINIKEKLQTRKNKLTHNQNQQLNWLKNSFEERISLWKNYKKISVISWVGVRDYYRKLWYHLEWTYMVKDL